MIDRIAITFVLSVTLLGLPVGSTPQGNRKTAMVSLPTDRTETIPSPDGAWALVAGPITERTIMLENRSEHTQTLVKEYSRSLQVGWSPDSRAFFVNDAYGSNLEDAFIYWIGNKETPITQRRDPRQGQRSRRVSC